ncbi:MAG: hypothetical protein ABIR47_16390 [Candidatus Kapaibacterium sp.]
MEYRPGFTRCSDCHVDLVGELEPDDDLDWMDPLELEAAQEHRRLSKILLWSGIGGFLLGILAASVLTDVPFSPPLSVAIMGCSYLTVGLSAAFYAKSKGYSWAHGLYFFLGLIGLLVLLNMKDKIRDPRYR